MTKIVITESQLKYLIVESQKIKVPDLNEKGILTKVKTS
jgi:hypothetical protein